MHVDRNKAIGAQRGSAVIRICNLVTPESHAAVAIKNSATWALWGGQPEQQERRHSCGVKVSQRCRAASELRALYIYLVECYAPGGTNLTVRMSHPRALAQMQYWLSVEDPSQLSLPRMYHGKKLAKLARLTFDLRGRISVFPTSQSDERHIEAGRRLLHVMHKALPRQREAFQRYLNEHAHIEL